MKLYKAVSFILTGQVWGVRNDGVGILRRRIDRTIARRLPLLGLLAAGLGLSACQTAPVDDMSSPFSVPPEGSTFELRSSLTVARRSARITIQNGRVASTVRFYEPYCTLHLIRTREEMGQSDTVSPDSFEITETYRRMSRPVASTPVLIAANQIPPLEIQVAESGSNRNRYMKTYFELQSPRQPGVQQLVCSRYGRAAGHRYLSVEEIDEILGALGTFNLTTPQSSGPERIDLATAESRPTAQL
jgi:hypothetical protein